MIPSFIAWLIAAALGAACWVLSSKLATLRAELEWQRARKLPFGSSVHLAGKIVGFTKKKGFRTRYTVKTDFEEHQWPELFYEDIILPIPLDVGDDVGVFIGVNRATTEAAGS